jgi:hypothetical protein
MRRQGRKALPRPWWKCSGWGDRSLMGPLPLSHPCTLAHVVAHVISLLCQPHCCLPSTQPLSSPTLFYTTVNAAVVCHRHPHCHYHVVNTHVIVRCRRHHCHDRCFCRYCCCFLADCCLWTLPGALPAAPLPLFVTSLDDVVLPPWASASDDADSRRADARRSLGCCCPSPIGIRPCSRQQLVCFVVVIVFVTYTCCSGGRMIGRGGDNQQPLSVNRNVLPTTGGGPPKKRCDFCPRDKTKGVIFVPWTKLGTKQFCPIVVGAKLFCPGDMYWCT